MADRKDRRHGPGGNRNGRALQGNAHDLVNGQKAGSSLPFVGQADSYYNMNTLPDSAAESFQSPSDSGDVGGGGAGAVAPPVTTQPVQGDPVNVVPITFGSGSVPAVQPDPGSALPQSGQVSAGSGIITPAPPVASAGQDQIVTLPTNTVTLNGSGSSDPQGSQLTYVWGMDSGPSSPGIVGASTVNPTITNLIAGTYIFKLYLWNALGQESTSMVSVTVKNPDGSSPPSGPANPVNTATAIAATVDISTAPTGNAGPGPYGGAGAGGDGQGEGQGGAGLSAWEKIMWFSRRNWPWLLLAAAGAAYVIFGKDKKKP